MRKQNFTLEDLINENKQALLNDPEALSRIDERIDERNLKSLNNSENK